MLCRRPEADAVRFVTGDARVRLHRVVVDHRKRERVFEDTVALAKRCIHVAPLVAVLVAEVGVVDGFAGLGECFVDAGDRWQLPVLDLDEFDRSLGCGEVDRGHRCDGLALESHLVDGNDGPVLSCRSRSASPC